MKKKLNRLAGFTLAELLIVVAIIGVLVAISIPIFTSRLEASRESTDAANLRSAYAAATTALLTGKYGPTPTALPTGTNTFYYSKNGDLVTEAGSAMKGKSTQNDYQGEDMTDLPDGIIFAQTGTKGQKPGDTASRGNSGNGPICLLITYKDTNGAADKVEVFFGTKEG